MACRGHEDGCGSEESHAASGGWGNGRQGGGGGYGLEGGILGEEGELIWSLETGSTLPSFKTGRSWLSSMVRGGTSSGYGV